MRLFGYKVIRFLYVTLYYYFLPFVVIIWNYGEVMYTFKKVEYVPGVFDELINSAAATKAATLLRI